MKVIVFGASGRIGRPLVAHTLAAGHEVTAVVNRGTLEPAPGLTVVSADVLDPAAVCAVMPGHDSVICVLGAGRAGVVRSTGTANIIAAMKAQGIRRLICQSTLGAGDSAPALNFFWKYLMFGLLLRPAYADHQAQEQLVQNSGLDWTLVRPAAFTDGPLTGQYRHGFAATAKNLTLKISRNDLASFLVKQLTSAQYLLKAPGLSY
jgi:putative NADH-flavin reductase